MITVQGEVSNKYQALTTDNYSDVLPLANPKSKLNRRVLKEEKKPYKMNSS